MRQPARRLHLLGPGTRPVPRTRRGRTERGVSALELAMVAPALIFLIFFTIQGALYFYGKAVAIQAAREGVSQLRLAQDRAVYEDLRPHIVDSTERFARNVGREALIDPLAAPRYDDVNGRVSMEVSGAVITLVPFMELRVTERAEGSVERFEAPAGAP